MEQIFAKLVSTGQNTVEKLVQWILNSKLGGTANNKNTVMQMFSDVANPKNVDLAKFTSVIQELVRGNNLNLDEVKKKLAKSGGSILKSAATAGLNMFKKKLPF